MQMAHEHGLLVFMTTVKIEQRRSGFWLVLIACLVSIALFSAFWAGANGRELAESQRNAPILLQVPALAQSRGTSCGEAVIVMAYNHAHPQAPLTEAQVIAYATEQGYFTEASEPFTSPANMLRITRNYTNEYSSGVVFLPDQGLTVLIRQLKRGAPVIIDVLTHLDDRNSGAHFVLITGMALDPNDTRQATIYFNNPQTGANEAAAWGGEMGIWHAWQNNPDPGGAGWWMVISPG